jgi:hypothetical protein
LDKLEYKALKRSESTAMVSAVAAADTMAMDSESLQAATTESELPDEMEEREGDKLLQQDEPDDIFGELEDKALKRF